MTDLLRVPTTVVDGSIARLKAFVADVNSTNWTIFTGTLVGMLTAVVVLACMVLKIPLDPTVLGIWVAFVAGWIGFGVRQFNIKRKTHDEHGPQARAARASRTTLETPRDGRDL
jgi:ABC-type uncharacterized transport system permease subunit